MLIVRVRIVSLLTWCDHAVESAIIERHSVRPPVCTSYSTIIEIGLIRHDPCRAVEDAQSLPGGHGLAVPIYWSVRIKRLQFGFKLRQSTCDIFCRGSSVCQVGW